MSPEQLIVDLNTTYAALHTDREQQFWETYMGISDGHNEFEAADERLMRFKQDKQWLDRCRDALDAAPAEAQSTLAGWIAFFEANVIEDTKASKLRTQIASLENVLDAKRKKLTLGYVDPESGETVAASSIAMRLKLVSSPDAKVREACYRGLESIETFALDEGFIDMVAQRNQFARRLGFTDFYDYRLRTTEGFGKDVLRGYLDRIEEQTRPAAQAFIDKLRVDHGESALEPWNYLHVTAGDAVELLEPYMQFGDAVSRWGRTFSAMGVRFAGATVQLDLVDRRGKYENGFCHAPVVPYIDADGQNVRATINFSSNAVPGQTGSGMRAAQTLFHEGGHAAHFANVAMPSPCFSQEFAPTSPAMAETQSMFFDSLLGDADWLRSYADVPWHVVKQYTEQTHPLRVLELRGLLAIAFAELDLYSLADDELTPKRIMEVFVAAEQRLTLLDRSPRPTLAVPHLLNFDSSAIYHGYILASAAVAQTRRYFLDRDGFLTDNAEIGPALRAAYWQRGNAEKFVDFVEQLTGTPFSVDALVSDVSASTETAVKSQRHSFEAAPSRHASGTITLDLDLRIAHGTEAIAQCNDDSFETGALAFKTWLAAAPKPN